MIKKKNRELEKKQEGDKILRANLLGKVDSLEVEIENKDRLWKREMDRKNVKIEELYRALDEKQSV